MGTWSDITYVWNTLGYPFPVGAHGVLLGEGLKRMVSRQSPNDLTTRDFRGGMMHKRRVRTNQFSETIGGAVALPPTTQTLSIRRLTSNETLVTFVQLASGVKEKHLRQQKQL